MSDWETVVCGPPSPICSNHGYSTYQLRQCTNRTMYYNVIWRRVRVTTVAVEKQYYICEWVSVALVIRHAKRMGGVKLSSVASIHIFPYYLSNGTIFGGGGLLNINCVFRFSLQRFSDTFLILRRIQRDIIINVHRSACKVLLVLVRF